MLFPARCAALAALALLAACGANATDSASDTTASVASAPTSTATVGTDLQPDAGRQVITVQMITDDAGSRFEPADIAAKPGDVVRFVLQSGVHNVSFPADSSPGASNLPPASQFLQLPGQTWDVKVALPAGSYFYQCDPHAALGMVGRITVSQ